MLSLSCQSSTHFVANNVWDRIQDGAKYGDVLVTIATGDLADDEADSLGLVPTHAYAVIGIYTHANMLID